MEFLELATWLAIGKIIIIDLVLSCDNAVVIGMAAGKLDSHLQKKAIFWGTGGAIVLRLLFAFVLAEALHYIPALHVIGGIILLWIAVKLLVGEDEQEVTAKDSLLGAVVTILVADAMMSIDNVLGIVAAANGQMELIAAGILITIPLILFSASLFAKLIHKYPAILYFGGAVLAWVGGEMVAADNIIQPFINGYELWVSVVAVIITFMAVWIINQVRK